MTREEYRYTLLELLSKEKETKQQYKITIDTIENEINLLTEKYAIEHTLFDIGNEVIYTDCNGIEYKKIIHEITVLTNADIVYDIGDITKITHKNVYHKKLKKIN